MLLLKAVITHDGMRQWLIANHPLRCPFLPSYRLLLMVTNYFVQNVFVRVMQTQYYYVQHKMA